MTPYRRHEAEERRRDQFEALCHTLTLLALAGLAWWLS
jgi:hypothetical protein